jgi:Flp pilus assembly pilin Flp
MTMLLHVTMYALIAIALIAGAIGLINTIKGSK